MKLTGAGIGTYDSSKGTYLALPNRDTTTVTLIAHYLTWRTATPVSRLNTAHGVATFP